MGVDEGYFFFFVYFNENNVDMLIIGRNILIFIKIILLSNHTNIFISLFLLLLVLLYFYIFVTNVIFKFRFYM